jgi:hypothetical protein
MRGPLCRLDRPRRSTTSSVFEQWVVIVTGFGVKPVYTVLSLIVIVRLWRQGAPDLVALRRGLIAFWLGENACAIDYLVFHGEFRFVGVLSQPGNGSVFFLCRFRRV